MPAATSRRCAWVSPRKRPAGERGEHDARSRAAPSRTRPGPAGSRRAPSRRRAPRRRRRPRTSASCGAGRWSSPAADPERAPTPSSSLPSSCTRPSRRRSCRCAERLRRRSSVYTPIVAATPRAGASCTGPWPIAEQRQSGDDDADPGGAQRAEVVAEQHHPADRGEECAAAAGDRVAHREVAVVVGPRQPDERRRRGRARWRRRTTSPPPASPPMATNTDAGQHTGDEEDAPQRQPPITALLDQQVPPGVQHRGGQREQRRSEHAASVASTTRRSWRSRRLEFRCHVPTAVRPMHCARSRSSATTPTWPPVRCSSPSAGPGCCARRASTRACRAG